MRAWILRLAYVPQNEAFSVFFASFMVLLAVVGLVLDFSLEEDFYWFQRTGALLVLAGVELQYAKLTSMWKSELDSSLSVPTVQERIDSGQGVSMLEEAKTSEATRKLAMLLHRMVTEKSAKDVWAVAFVIVGTIVWGFGDLPFRA